MLTMNTKISANLFFKEILFLMVFVVLSSTQACGVKRGNEEVLVSTPKVVQRQTTLSSFLQVPLRVEAEGKPSPSPSHNAEDDVTCPSVCISNEEYSNDMPIQSKYFFIPLGEKKHDELYAQLMTRQYIADYYVGVKTTGIACRFGCSTATLPLQKNVFFSRRLADLICFGLRECKRCKPLSFGANESIKPFLDEIQGSSYPNKMEKGAHAESSQWITKTHHADLLRYINTKRVNYILQNETALSFHPLSTLSFQRYWTPVGVMIGCFSQKGLCLLEFFDRRMLEAELLTLQKKYKARFICKSTALSERLRRELQEYFNGSRSVFTVPLDRIGSAFQLSVWDALAQIPYGMTSTYKRQAEAISQPKAIRAVANANGKNCISILIPCHRVISDDEKLLGYGGGLERKQFLLDLEASSARK